MKEHSLARRAIALVLCAEMVCALTFSITALWHEHRTKLRAFDVMLHGRSDSLLGAVQDAEDPDDNVTIDPVELKLPDDDVYAVYNQGGRLLGSSPDAPKAITERHGDGIRNVKAGGRQYRVLESEGLRIIDRAENSGVGLRRPVTIVYAARTRRMWHETFEAAGFYIGASAVLIVLTAIVLIVALRSLLHPLEELALAAAGVDANVALFTPPASTLRTRELKPLAEALSAAIGRLRHALDMEHRFVSDAAHELKTSVAVLRSTVQLIALRRRTPEEYEAGLERVLQDNERVEQILQRMLMLGRFEEQTAEFGAVTDLSEGVRRTAQYLSSWIEEREVQLTLQLEDDVMIPMPAEAAEILVSNLLMNAVQHSPKGGRVEIAVGCQLHPRKTATLQVKDAGPGIAPESLPHVFERFYREDSSRSRVTGGAGLGLAICKSIVENAKGSMQVESALGCGTVVTATFSLA